MLPGADVLFRPSRGIERKSLVSLNGNRTSIRPIVKSKSILIHVGLFVNTLAESASEKGKSGESVRRPEAENRRLSACDEAVVSQM